MFHPWVILHCSDVILKWPCRCLFSPRRRIDISSHCQQPKNTKTNISDVFVLHWGTKGLHFCPCWETSKWDVTLSPWSIECLSTERGKRRASGVRCKAHLMAVICLLPFSRLYKRSPSRQGQTTSFNAWRHSHNIVCTFSCRLCKSSTSSHSQLVKNKSFVKPAGVSKASWCTGFNHQDRSRPFRAHGCCTVRPPLHLDFQMLYGTVSSSLILHDPPHVEHRTLLSEAFSPTGNTAFGLVWGEADNHAKHTVQCGYCSV